MVSEATPEKKKRWFRGWWWKLPTILLAGIEIILVFGSQEGSMKTCSDLSPDIISLSKKQNSPFARKILKLYDIKEQKVSGKRILNCTAMAKLNRGDRDRTIDFYIEQDADGDRFYGFKMRELCT